MIIPCSARATSGQCASRAQTAIQMSFLKPAVRPPLQKLSRRFQFLLCLHELHNMATADETNQLTIRDDRQLIHVVLSH